MEIFNQNEHNISPALQVKCELRDNHWYGAGENETNKKAVYQSIAVKHWSREGNYATTLVFSKWIPLVPGLIYGPVKTHVVFNLLLPESASLMKCGSVCVRVSVCLCVSECVHAYVCVCLIMMYGLRSDSLSMNFLSDKYAFSYTDWLSCKPVLTLCQSTYKHTHTYTYLDAHSHIQRMDTTSQKNNDSCAWGRIVWMPGAVHWYQFHETWLQRISYKQQGSETQPYQQKPSQSKSQAKVK